LLVVASVVPSSPIIVTLINYVLTRTTRHNIP
jgi:hypothetical protein